MKEYESDSLSELEFVKLSKLIFILIHTIHDKELKNRKQIPYLWNLFELLQIFSNLWMYCAIYIYIYPTYMHDRILSAVFIETDGWILYEKIHVQWYKSH